MTLVVYRAKDGWRWRAVSRNGETIASGEAHTRRWSARRAALRAFPSAHLRYETDG